MIKAENLTKTYHMGDISINALNGIDLSIEKGEMVSIMGPSGSGKSTFLNILGCLDIPSSGKCYLNGIDITHLNKDKQAEIRNKQIGFVFQGFNLLSRTTALENVELPMIYARIPSKERKERAIKALETVGLKDRIYHLPNQLSGGQQQRVAIARSIVNDAPIIIADEPTGNLDSVTSCEIMEFFLQLNKESDKTIIIVTHEEDIASYGERIIRFKDGKIIVDEKKNK
ncbi:MAG: ABC transporter ATP-binding protein [Vampirovibrionia bacterium]